VTDEERRQWWAMAEKVCPVEYERFRHQQSRFGLGKGVITGREKARAKLIQAMAKKGFSEAP
jgi:hypothetical protein